MHEFNKAGIEVPNKRKRTEDVYVFEGANEKGESMYQTLVTRDTTPHGVNLPASVVPDPKALSVVGDIHAHRDIDQGSINLENHQSMNIDRQVYARDNRLYGPKRSVRSSP